MDKINFWSCPVGCKYCAITEVEYRAKLWDTMKNNNLISINKAVTIINPPRKKTESSLHTFYSLPLTWFEWDIVGFNAITDPFWPKYSEQLDYFLEKIAPKAKLAVCVTKFPVREKMMEKLSKIPNFRLTVSLTGLDMIENKILKTSESATVERLETLRLAKEYWVLAFPLIHPYISGMSNLNFLYELKNMWYDSVDVKWFRYDNSMNSWLPKNVQELYVGTGGKEVLIDDWWAKKITGAWLKLMSLKSWYRKMEGNANSLSLSYDEALFRTLDMVSYSNITSSDTDEAVIEATILRKSW